MGIVRQISLIDEDTGEFISSNVQKVGSKLKEGWIVVYKNALVKLITECPNFATMKVYLRIAAAQDYDKITYITTSYISKSLNMSYQTAWNAIKWLIANDYLRRAVNDTGGVGFIVNPLVTTCGKKNFDKKLEAFADSDFIIDDVEDVPLKDIARSPSAIDEFFSPEEPPDADVELTAEDFASILNGDASVLEEKGTRD